MGKSLTVVELVSNVSGNWTASTTTLFAINADIANHKRWLLSADHAQVGTGANPNKSPAKAALRNWVRDYLQTNVEVEEGDPTHLCRGVK